MAQPHIAISQVVIGPQRTDSKTDFSLVVKFKNTQATIKQWQFGLFMPRNFRSFNRTNQHLKLQICEQNSHACAKLGYLKNKFTDPDLSTVFTSIFGPLTPFPLRSGRYYSIALLHNSSTGPLNYSSLPQSMFLATANGIISLDSTPNNYTLTNYSATATQAKIQQHLMNTWKQSSFESSPLAIIPAPTQVELASGNFNFTLPLTITSVNLDSPQLNQLWQQALLSDLNLPSHLLQAKLPPKSGIVLQLVPAAQIENPEGYRLQISQQQILVQASHPAGIFYALQSLRQLWYANPQLPLVTINDAPRFKYRGLMLDVARHYFNLEQIESLIDVMASLKLNTLHIHLSDDEAFRLNLPSFPELALIGGQRGWNLTIGPLGLIQNSLSKSTAPLASAATNYAGNYTPAMIKQLINYANTRQITLIPELDIPAHARALRKAMPTSFYETADQSVYPGYGDNVLPICAYTNSSQFGFNFRRNLINLLNQTADLFNDQTTVYAINHELSIGGDEVYTGTWDHSPLCQVAPWKNLTHLEKEHYFFELLNNESALQQLHLSGWHEFVMDKTGNLASMHRIRASETGHVWVWGKSAEVQTQAATLANHNYPVVLTYADSLYFDQSYTPALNEVGLYWATQFGDTYASLNSAQQATQTLTQTSQPQAIVGLEGALWTDVIPDYQQLQYMALPKLTGLAEASWNRQLGLNSQPNWHSLSQRLGCGIRGYLAFAHTTFGFNYRGYPNGIAIEAPVVCQEASTLSVNASRK